VARVELPKRFLHFRAGVEGGKKSSSCLRTARRPTGLFVPLLSGCTIFAEHAVLPSSPVQLLSFVGSEQRIKPCLSQLQFGIAKSEPDEMEVQAFILSLLLLALVSQTDTSKLKAV